ncbi:MAG: hypothetical protein ACI9J3_002679 [Parvicellaceae bacterium]|jgi:hypothetical protein
MLRWIVSHILVFSLVTTTMVFPKAAQADLKGLKLNNIGLLVVGLAAPAFYLKCPGQMSSKIFMGTSLVYLASEAMNFSKYSEDTSINTEEIKAIEAGASSSPKNLQIESLRFAAKEKNDQAKAAKKKGSIIQIVGAGYGIAAAVALFEQYTQKTTLATQTTAYGEDVLTAASGVTGNAAAAAAAAARLKMPNAILYGSPGPYYAPVKWSTCDDVDPMLDPLMVKADGSLNKAGQAAALEQSQEADAAYDACKSGPTPGDCGEPPPGYTDRNIAEAEELIEEAEGCVAIAAADRPEGCDEVISEATTQLDPKEGPVEAEISDKGQCQGITGVWNSSEGTCSVPEGNVVFNANECNGAATVIPGPEDTSNATQGFVCQSTIDNFTPPEEIQEEIRLEDPPEEVIVTDAVTGEEFVETSYPSEADCSAPGVGGTWNTSSFTCAIPRSNVVNSPSECPSGGVTTVNNPQGGYFGFTCNGGAPISTEPVEDEGGTTYLPNANEKNAVANNFDSYMMFKERVDFVEGNRIRSTSIEEYENLKRFTSKEDLAKNNWAKPLETALEAITDVMVPKADAGITDMLGQLGLVGGIGGAFMQIMAKESILGKTIERWDGNKRGIAFGAMAALAFLTGKQVKGGAKQLKEEAQIYTDLADKLEGEANNTFIGDDDTTSGATAGGPGGPGGGGGTGDLARQNLDLNGNVDSQTEIPGGGPVVGDDDFDPNAKQVNCFNPGLVNLDENCDCAETDSCRTPLLSTNIPFAANSPIAIGVGAVRDTQSKIDNGRLGQALLNESKLSALDPAIKGLRDNLEDEINAIRVKNGQAPIPFGKAVAKTLNDIRSSASNALSRSPSSVRAAFNSRFKNTRLSKAKRFTARKSRGLNYKNKGSSKSRGSTLSEFDFSNKPTQKEEVVELTVDSERGLAGYDLSAGQINENSSTSIFKVISNRYLKSGVQRLLERELVQPK